MDEKEMLEIDIGNLRNAYDKIQESLNDLRDVEEFEDTKYNDLFYIAESINELRIEKESKLERLEEIA